MSRIAVVGSGIAGLASAHLLVDEHEVTLFEGSHRLGGHSNTVSVDDPVAGPLGIDTGFIVHNDRNYPNLVRLFNELDIPVIDTVMSFGVTDRDPQSATNGVSYCATNPNTLFADRRNLARREMWRMLVDIARFYWAARRFLADPDETTTIAEFLYDGGYRREFVELHLKPMGAAVWSANPEQFGDFPATSLLRFLDNHGLLSIGNRPQWRTIDGGSRVYVDRIIERFKSRGGVVLTGSPVTLVERLGDGGARLDVAGHDFGRFDHVVLAVHSDQALTMLDQPTALESEVLGAIGYQPNRATLHTDDSVMPSQQRAWAAWNYDRRSGAHQRATLTYDMTMLQRLPGSRRYFVSLNSDDQIEASKVIASFDYSHPVFDRDAVAAQSQVAHLDPTRVVQYAGAWCGYGFHEDGIVSAVRAAERLGVRWRR